MRKTIVCWVALIIIIMMFGCVQGQEWDPEDFPEEDDSILVVIIVIAIIAIIGIGAIVILAIVRNSQSQMGPQQQYQTPPPPMQQQSQKAKFCPNCGTNNPPEYKYCGQCQKPLP